MTTARFYSLLLSAVVIVFGGFLGFYWFEARGLTAQTGSASDEDGRNEQSTPATFVLPATPAVTKEQELRLRERSDKAETTMLAMCTAQLVVTGYDVRGELVTFNPELVEATYLYQRSNGLPATGALDSPTRTKLKC